MKRRISTLLAAALPALSLAALAATSAAAQADALLRLRSGSPIGDRFRVDSAGGVLAVSELGIGNIPVTGEGYRLMWHPYKAAFRAGHADTEWDEANVGFLSWAGGNNTMASQYAAFAFGENTDATATYAVAFGASVQVSGVYGFGAGLQSRCAQTACIAIGNFPNANGDAAVAIGHRVTADADFSVAIGHRASTNGHTGAFVIGDASTTDSVEASANNQFSARYAGGYRLYTNATTTVGAALNAGGTTWSGISDRNRKENFLDLDGEDVLARLRRVPVSTWNFIAEGRQVRHVGPMAQDWHAAFALNDDPLTINSGDFDGVNLAAVQALERRTTRQATELAAQRSELAALRQRNADLEARLARLEALLTRP